MATTSALHGQDASNERFNAEAAGWDSNAFVHEATNAAYQALKSAVPILKGPGASSIDVLEIGCGTGVLSVQIANDVRHVVAIDAATGMIDVLRTKLNKPEFTKNNITPIAVLLEDPEDPALPPAHGDGSAHGPRRKFDLIISHLVLHHVPDLEPLLKTMLQCLKPGGLIALTDFEDTGPESRKFHPQSKLKGVERHGINRAWMTDLMIDVGFKDVDVHEGFTIPKQVERFEGEFGENAAGGPGQGKMMDFPFLICMGKR